jgi:hypothetical protein
MEQASVPVPAPRPRRLGHAVAAGLLAGILLGAGTQVLQGILPGDSNWLANSIAAWTVCAFVLGSRTHSVLTAAAGAIVLLLAALAAYEVVVDLRFGTGWGPLVSFWAAGAVAAGLVFGVGGWAWADGGAGGRAAGTALLAALLLTEGAYLHLILPGRWVGMVMIAIGLLLPALIGGRTWRSRGIAYLALLPAVGLGILGFLVLLQLQGAWTGVAA